MREFMSDLHIHTCLSSCGDLAMTPKAIVGQAKVKGLSIIGITDHNSAENVVAVQGAAKKEAMDLTVFPGLEVTSSEEVHLLALFPDADSALILQRMVYEHLSEGENDPDFWGYQVIIDADDGIIDTNSRLLAGATGIALDPLVEKVHLLNGIAIASHIDREAFSLLSNLGFIPQDLDIDALEISPLTDLKEAKEKYPCRNLPLVSFSDAHTIEDIGKVATRFWLEEPTLEEVRMALFRERGRKIIV